MRAVHIRRSFLPFDPHLTSKSEYGHKEVPSWKLQNLLIKKSYNLTEYSTSGSIKEKGY